MKKGFIFLTILVLTFAGIAISHAWWKGSHGGWEGGHGEECSKGLFPIVSLSLKYQTEIGLENGQITELQGIQDDFQKEAEATFNKIRELRKGISNDLEGNSFSEAEAKIKEVGELRISLKLRRLKAFKEAKTDILNPEQYNKLKDMMSSNVEGVHNNLGWH
jgi:Spy/CpxP family protein refolding chaperone